jgi:uncharacterized protein YbjQ (UPF0145 family)
MAVCSKCGGRFSFFEKRERINGAVYCRFCAQEVRDAMAGIPPQRLPNPKAALALRERSKKIFLYSIENPRGIVIEKYLGFISVRVVHVLSMLKNLPSSLTDDNGTRSEPFEKSFSEIEQTVLKELQKSADNRGADGVLGVRLEFHLLDGTGFVGVGSKLLVVVATGTAVKINVSPPTAERTQRPAAPRSSSETPEKPQPSAPSKTGRPSHQHQPASPAAKLSSLTIPRKANEDA